MKSLNPVEMSPNEVYLLLVSLVVPRPIALVSSISKDGHKNLAPFSFFMVGGANPASLMVSPVLGTNGLDKDTTRNIRETGEFVVNLVHYEMRDGMNQASKSIPFEESEWDHCGFTELASEAVKPARVLEAKVSLECRLFQIIEHGNGAGAARYVIGEIVRIHHDESLFAPIARLGGKDYLDLGTNQTFQLDRP